MTGIKLPYYASDLPFALPTNAEIEAATDISLQYGGRRIAEVGDHYVVKFGKGVDLTEGENMLFANKNTNINIPRVYALYSDPTNGKNYIVMERIAGETLLSLWPKLSPLEKELIATILRKSLDDLRQLPSPGYYGSLDERCLLDEIFWTTDPEPSINGPFQSTETFIEGMVPIGQTSIVNAFLMFYAIITAQHLPMVTFRERISLFKDIRRKMVYLASRTLESLSSTGRSPAGIQAIGSIASLFVL